MAVFAWFIGTVFFALAWSALYLRLVREKKLPPVLKFDMCGVKDACVFVVTLGAFIAVLKYACLGVSSASAAPPTPTVVTDGGMSWGFELFVFFGFLVVLTQCKNIVLPLWERKFGGGYVSRFICAGVLALPISYLVVKQVWAFSELTNNIFMLLVAFSFFVPLAFTMKRGGLVTLLLLIMALDVYLVWNTGTTATTGWYVQMIRSDTMQHWPLPMMIRVGGHGIGGGDVFFAVLVCVYALRRFGVASAVLSALLVSAPIVFIPIAGRYVHLPGAFPYTIFIAPVGLFLACWKPVQQPAVAPPVTA